MVQKLFKELNVLNKMRPLKQCLKRKKVSRKLPLLALALSCVVGKGHLRTLTLISLCGILSLLAILPVWKS